MKNIYLIGMMGCGKSTCSQALGKALSRPVLDTDHEIERQTGKTISEIFAQDGEDTFRDIETRLCESLSRQENLIVATGGGLPLRETNRELLRSRGLVLFLNRAPETIFDTGDMSKRPLGQQGREAFLLRFSQRLPLYRACAHREISDFSSVERTLAEILQYVEEAQ